LEYIIIIIISIKIVHKVHTYTRLTINRPYTRGDCRGDRLRRRSPQPYRRNRGHSSIKSKSAP